MDKKNIFDNINVDKINEEFIEILRDKDVRIERIVSNGQVSDEDFWYEQNENEFVLLLEGEAILQFENKDVKLKKGDFIDIKSRQRHRIKYTSLDQPTIWLAIFY
ncbi:MAG: cupin [Arcobacter sp.]|uniref:cupin domain-containing protein n=1 Tax=uncultured Arcobacter sp. TaxID=165434 RepID=UPI000CA7B6AD|nr:cupin domain-containing protein [uncultured Arcobacter sp.]PLY10674.1 MAG: cupin [Arcobacter sp.]